MDHQNLSSPLAVVADPALPARFAIRPVDAPRPRDNEAVVAVKAFSLNAGEVRDALGARAPVQPGWDLAGVVERAAANGAGPAAGTRVAGVSLRSGAWAQRVAVPVDALATMPDEVGFAEASALPVAGLTALCGLAKAGQLLGRQVLVTGASGGVGRYVARLAVLSGATVTAVLRTPAARGALREDGVQEVHVGDLAQLKAQGARFHLAFDTVGGSALAQAMTLLARGGLCVTCGNGQEAVTAFEARSFYHQGRVALMGLFLGAEFDTRPASDGLAVLLGLLRDGRLRPPIELQAPWSDIAEVAARYVRREIQGKAVLHVTD